METNPMNTRIHTNTKLTIQLAILAVLAFGSYQHSQ